MDSSGIRHRNIEKQQNNSKKKLDIIPTDAYNYLDGHHRFIRVKCYNYKERIYETLKDGFLIKEIGYNSYSVIGKLINNNIVSLTDDEQKICLSEGYSLEDTKKYQGYLGFF
jgi:hypothetical protein